MKKDIESMNNKAVLIGALSGSIASACLSGAISWFFAKRNNDESIKRYEHLGTRIDVQDTLLQNYQKALESYARCSGRQEKSLNAYGESLEQKSKKILDILTNATVVDTYEEALEEFAKSVSGAKSEKTDVTDKKTATKTN